MDNGGIAWRANFNRVHEPAKRGRRFDMLRHAQRKRRHVQRLADVADGPGLVVVVVPDKTGRWRKQQRSDSQQS
jgi:hypothetical protein